MKDLPSTTLRPGRRRRPRTALARVLRGTAWLTVGFLLSLLAMGGAAYAVLSTGPLRFSGLSERVALTIASRIGDGWGVEVNDAALLVVDGSLALQASGLVVRDPSGVPILRAPDTVVSLDTRSILTGSPRPRFVEFRDLDVRGTIAPDGTLSFRPASAPPADPSPREAGPPTEPAPAAAASAESAPLAAPGMEPSRLSVVTDSLLDVVLDPRGAIGALDRARLTRARLTLVDAEGRVRPGARFQVDGSFDRDSDGAHRFALDLAGEQGAWRVSGRAKVGPDGSREASIHADSVPVHDIVLFAGLSKTPADFDVKVSGDAVARLGPDQRLVDFEGRLVLGEGRVKVHGADWAPPIAIEGADFAARWSERERVLEVPSLGFRGGRTDLDLAGRVSVPRNDVWHGSFRGKGGRLPGPADGDAPIRLDTIEAMVRGTQDGLAIERLSLRGPALDVEAGVSVGAPEDAGGVTVRAKARETHVRSALRVWPQFASPNVRGYLVDTLKDGTAGSVDLAIRFTGEDLGHIAAGRPIPADRMAIAFALRDVTFRPVPGLPPMVQGVYEGFVSGVQASVTLKSARVAMPDGRALEAKAGGFVMDDLWDEAAIARIDLAVAGGADAAVSFLRLPAIGALEGVDPASVKGTTDLKVSIPLEIYDIPAMDAVPVLVTGQIADLAVDKVLGRERLEAGAFAVSYDRGSLQVKGEGRLTGTPAAIELRQPKGQAGEAVITATLDEAARSRRGITLPGQVTGPVAIRAVQSFGKGAKGGLRIEADLARAALEDVLPGWSKPAGRPGRLSFTSLDTERGVEFQDVVLDSGSVQVRGSVLLTGDGTLDKADFATFRLSPGDDMRVQVDRTGALHKVSVRGNVVDARPWLKTATSAPAPPQPQGQTAARAGTRETRTDTRDKDLDLAVNIVSGFNEEALTNVSLKASMRRGELRTLQMSGRFPRAPVSAQLIRPERTSPVLMLRSEDAGALLRFADIYARMIGGELNLQMATEGRQSGSVTVQNFVLRNEPALRRIISQQPADGSGPVPGAINAGEVQFVRARAEFVRSPGRIDFRDAVISGAQIGFTLEGWIDQARDRTDIAGTFVPAYGLNNVFAQVPLFGPLLGGGRDEGLFAVNFRITGAASAPTLSVNPLSAIAPGIFRKLFGAIPGAEPPAGSPSPPRPVER